ncbi:YSIRK-type signal peptide-containing protein [Staphylococcus cohnii]|uniref:YSIRK-type signal peptide-containing protein n=1 Tax=Staphylococcus cohnii TaxID=29382 RepID=A0ABT6J2Y5_9STAP|nr:YSIRK-type signal peptide-containing protein [Staphylococcus cohnii]MDH5140813.1 YSIRK-type signal peptide-containing protein [Staphylococcus cohnii]MDH5158890.1 YSIRK-type signal peptide-containing protein [Staphylococcus cohnii]MDH5170434.1 YSIRK-type signal peptide-containing protein [Staphylococcus cohnii]
MKRDRKQRFSIRKFSMGTGSILLGFTILQQ